jgi:hypothetical protein
VSRTSPFQGAVRWCGGLGPIWFGLVWFSLVVRRFLVWFGLCGSAKIKVSQPQN